tara:strand:+ start:754 stop:1692 length:939 start_codon:yes stop_codon:yes gene_type:complete
MKKFIYKTSLFGLTVLFFIISVLLIINKIYKFPIDPNYDNIEFEKAFNKANFKAVIIGNSKVHHALDKKTFNDYFNYSVAYLGSLGTNISVSKLTLESYLNNCKLNPDFVFLEVSWFTFSTNRTNYTNLSAELFLNDLNLFKYFNKYHEIKLLIFNSILRQLKMTENEIIYDKNIDKKKKNSPLTKDYIFDNSKFMRTFPKRIAGINNLFLDDYYAIIDLCKEKNIKLILFTAPEDLEYSKYQKDREVIKKIFKESKEKYNNLIYLDYTYGGDFYNKDYENWLNDSHHIYHSDLFSKLFIKDLNLHTNLTKP